MPFTTIEWMDNKIKIIDQTKLPHEVVFRELRTLDEVAEAIRALRVRGAPAIGIAAAFGVVVGLQNFRVDTREAFYSELERVTSELLKTRPTAINLGWALRRMRRVAMAATGVKVDEIRAQLLAEAQRILSEDRDICRAIGRHGAGLIPEGAKVLTHCNTGALVTADFGTALGVLFTAKTDGKKIHVYVDETRPLLQGARLNMLELMQEGIACTLICDNAAASLMQHKKIDCCIVGADRIARNGDTANKIGTYSLAVNAKHHGVPFYVAAPISSIDFSMASGAEIPIEHRSPDEVTTVLGRRIAPENATAYNPAFDVTPAALISAIVTEDGVARPPYGPAIGALEK